MELKRKNLLETNIYREIAYGTKDISLTCREERVPTRVLATCPLYKIFKRFSMNVYQHPISGLTLLI
jgi:hypothetical protein